MDQNEDIENLEPIEPGAEGGQGQGPESGAPPVDGAAPQPSPAAEAARASGTGEEAASVAPESAVSFRTQGARNDASAEISVSFDGMRAEGTFVPAMGEGRPLEVDYVRELIAGLGIVAGIRWDDIADAVMRCNLDRKIVRGLVVAMGVPPVAEVPAHAALEPRFIRKGPLVEDSVRRVDFRELSSVFVVRANEVIARVIPRKDGVEGSDVRGSPTPYQRESPESYAAGRNVAQREDRLEAAVDGRLMITGNRLDVDEVLMIKGGVDFHTGHIAFPGDVIIEGQVHDGFRVQSGGSIVCKSTLDAFEVSAKKDLQCPQGIIGRRRAQIRVGGELVAKYVQNCKVAVRGNAKISTALVNSRLMCLGSVDLGDKGVVMGGEIHSLHGLRCGRLGNQALQHTLVRVGIDFLVEQRLAQANERMRLVAARARQVDAAAKARPGPELDRAKAEIAKASATVRDLVTELLAKLDADDSATVEVRGEVFPGVIVEICRVSVVVSEPMKACVFRLDKAAGRIIIGK